MGKKIRKKLTREELERLCFDCKIPCNLVMTKVMGVKVEAYKCPKCREITFTSKQASKGFLKIKEEKMQNQYKKRPIKIGHSLGLTFPKRIVEVFNLSKKSKLNIKPKLKKNIIEIEVG